VLLGAVLVERQVLVTHSIIKDSQVDADRFLVLLNKMFVYYETDINKTESKPFDPRSFRKQTSHTLGCAGDWNAGDWNT
jgi:hypothetical protein